MNRLKNRVDTGNYISVDFDVLERLPWPASAERKKRTVWSGDDASEIGQYEGTPISIEGYLVGVKEEGPESPNCKSEEPELRDYHMWLTKDANEDRSNSIVVETTPRVRARHPAWKLSSLRHLSKLNLKFRISGWVLFDPEHPDQVGKTRATIWEIHPVMKIEVKEPLGWKNIDDIAVPTDTDASAADETSTE